MKFRRLEKTDIPAIREIAKDAFPVLWTESEFQYFIENPCAYCTGIEEEGTLFAYFLGLLVQGELDMISIAVHPKMLRQGLATVLMREVLKSEKIEVCFLEVDVSNLRAVNLYEKLGFTRYGMRKKYYQGKHDAILMKWSRTF